MVGAVANIPAGWVVEPASLPRIVFSSFSSEIAGSFFFIKFFASSYKEGKIW